MKKPLTYISLFSSAGVGCFGFKNHGFECIATNEFYEKRIKIQEINNKCRYATGYIQGDINLPEIKKRLENEFEFWKRKHSISELDVLIATPPCQGMSVANHKKNNEIHRNSLVVESINLTKKFNPKFFVFENVRSFLNTICTDNDGVEKKIKDAIDKNLGGQYNILYKIINFKEFGSHSSRTRTLVLGVRKDIRDVSPFDIFPDKSNPLTLRELFASLPELKVMGSTAEKDIYHNFRSYDTKMLDWIIDIKEGQSAFDNTDKNKIPYQIKDGVRVINTNKNGNKYSRWYWDREGPCIHTRNDILSSQNTIHPKENRVFSIRELMLMMSIPKDFKWTDIPLTKLNKFSDDEKKAFLKKEELNIRQCIGEAVPTGVFSNIALKIKNIINRNTLTIPNVKLLIDEKSLSNTENLIEFIEENFDDLGIENIFLIAEYANSKRQENAAYFTRSDIAFSVIKSLPEFNNKKRIRILEPSVGVGNFIPLLLKKYQEINEVILDVNDIDEKSLLILKKILSKIKIPSNFTINYHCSDFLLKKDNIKYDLIVGNPPYGKITKNQKLLRIYKENLYNNNTNNIFSYFIEKASNISEHVAFIVPKSLINSPEFDKTRELMNHHNLQKICDYGEKAFRDVKIETISFLFSTGKQKDENILIESYITNEFENKKKDYIFSDKYPYWLIYRNENFDTIADKLKFDIFDSFRDRQITTKLTKTKGKIRVLKSRNIGSNKILSQNDADCYIDDYADLAVSKFLNKKNVVMVPNLTYYPRATFLPSDTIVDGSVALLTLKNGSRLPTEKDLAYFGSKEFENFYRVARNYGTRSLNIDNNSVFFFGLLKDN